MALGIPVSHLRYEWGDRVVLEQITGMLEGDSRIRAVAMVHHETSVGRLNPVVEVGRLLAPRRIRFMVDVVSSLGAEEFDTVRARASVVIGSANKCLHSVAGLGFVLVKHDLWEDTEHVRPRSMYLDLRRYRAAAKESGQTPFTPPVSAIAALDEALSELEDQGGTSARRASYQALHQQIREGLKTLGFKLRFETPGNACSLTVASLPPGMTFDVFYAGMRDRGFLVYRGKGSDQPRHIPRRQHGSPGFGHGGRLPRSGGRGVGPRSARDPAPGQTTSSLNAAAGRCPRGGERPAPSSPHRQFSQVPARSGRPDDS